MKTSLRILTITLCLLGVWGAPSLAGETGDAKTIIISGAGPSTKVVELLGKEFKAANPGYSILVPPQSIKHKGGLEWVAGRGMLFGRTGRPLSEKDKADFSMLAELPLAKIKIAFAVSKELGVTKLSQEQLKGIYTGKITNWKEVGGQDRRIMLLGREKSESVFSEILKHFPDMANAPFVQIYDKDPEIIRFVMEVPGGIGFSTKTEFEGKEKLCVLEIEGFNGGLQVGLVYDKKNEDAPTVKAIRDLVNGPRWRDALNSNDFLPF